MNRVLMLALFLSLAACQPQGTAAPEPTGIPTLPQALSPTPEDESIVRGRFPGSDADGALYGFGRNDALKAQLVNEGWKLVEDSEGHLSGSFNAADNTCSVAMPENLVSGSWIGESDNGTITYYFPGGEADQEGWWHNIPLPEDEGWRCVAVVAQEGNHLGPGGSELKPGTVAVKFVNDSGKAGLEVMDGFLEIMWSAGNTAVWEKTETGIKMTITTPQGQKFDRQMDFYIPASEAVQQAQADFEKYGYSIEGLEFIEDENGVRAIDPETGVEVFVNGEFDLEFAVFNLDPDDLVATKYKPKDKSRVGAEGVPEEYTIGEYFLPLKNRMKEKYKMDRGIDPKTNIEFYFSPMMLDFEKLAWGLVVREYDSSDPVEYLVYETSEDNIIYIPVMQGSSRKAIDFWKNRSK